MAEDAGAAPKRPPEGGDGGDAKRAKGSNDKDWETFAAMLKKEADKEAAKEAAEKEALKEAAATAALAAERAAAPDDDVDADFDAIFDGGDSGGPSVLAGSKVQSEPSDEVARRRFADKATVTRQIDAEDLETLLKVLNEDAPKWEALRRWRSCALLLVVVSRSSRIVRGNFISAGLPILGAVLQEAVTRLETGDAAARQEAGMWALACLTCLRCLSLGRAALWEHRHSLGKPFDRLHRWCSREKTALAAELRAPTNALCQRWKRQPRPAGQAKPGEKELREKVVEMVAQGLLGIAGGNSPASPLPMSLASPGAMPTRLVSVEIEAALFGRFGSASHEYKQHARMLRSNLAHRENAQLRERVITGDIAPAELAAMDSEHLAPASLQEVRKKAEAAALNDSVVQDLLPRMRSRDDDFGMGSVAWYTAPPVFEKSPLRLKSTDSVGSSGSKAGASQEELDKTTVKEERQVPVVPLEPPPTPFRDMSAPLSALSAVPPTAPPSMEPLGSPDLLATPAPDEEDEEQDMLVQYLSKPVRL